MKDTILAINVVEPALVAAVKMHSKEMGIDIKGVMLVNTSYAADPRRPIDNTGLFEEILCDFDDIDALQTALKPFQDRLLAVQCRYESAILQLKKIIPFIPYIHTPTETSLLWSTQKPMMRDRIGTYDPSLVPKYKQIQKEDIPQLGEKIDGFTYPMIVKPSNLASSLLVTRCNDEAELRACLDHTFAVIKDIFKREHRHNEPSVLIEEMMQGDMYSTDAYVTFDGEVLCLPLVKVVTAHSVGLPGFYGYERIIPIEMEAAEVAAAFTAATAGIRALGLRATTTHVEMFNTPTGWKIIEIAARIGGYRDAIYREAYGVEHFYNDLAIRMGKRPVMPGDAISNAVVVNIYPETEGELESIEGLEEANRLESVLFVAGHLKPGEQAVFSNNGGEVTVDGILSNKDPEQLRKDVEKVRELIKINIK